MSINYKKNIRNHLGFVILYAVLLVSIILAISLSLFNITLKQLVLSLVARDSQVAFFAADNARNCAKNLYKNIADTTERPFGFIRQVSEGDPLVSGDETYDFALVDISAIQSGCGDTGISVGTVYEREYGIGSNRTVREISFPVFFTSDGGSGVTNSCANVKVEITVDNTPKFVDDAIISVRGFNLSGPGQCPLADSDRVVERGVQTGYGY